MMPANPSQDTMGPMTRTVADAARVLDVIAGYDPNDPVTAYTYGQLPATYTASLKPDALKGARIGILRSRRDTTRRAPAPIDTSAPGVGRREAQARDSVEFAKVTPLFAQAVARLKSLGAEVVDSITVNTGGGRFANNFETEEATDKYLAQHPNAPYKTLKQILLASGGGMVAGERARALINLVGRSTAEPGFGALMVNRDALRVELLKTMADQKLDAIIYATFDAQASEIPPDILTRVGAYSSYGYTRGDNRFLSPTLGWPAITVPMGFTSDSMPMGLEFLGRPFSEPKLLGFAFAYEQATRHRRPPRTTPPLAPTK
jgi:Asp-tRNA(Asn)/Glu-tRNA(Gln) amidotransferase A subunit family amidase